MNARIVYECEKCGYESTDYERIRKCEQNHNHSEIEEIIKCEYTNGLIPPCSIIVRMKNQALFKYSLQSD